MNDLLETEKLKLEIRKLKIGILLAILATIGSLITTYLNWEQKKKAADKKCQ